MLAAQETGSVALSGLLLGVLLAPGVVLAPLAGVALDRSRRPGTLILTASLLGAAALAYSGLLALVPTWSVVLALLVAGCCTPAFSGGLSSFVASVVPGTEKAFAADALSYNISGIAGPALAAAIMVIAPARTAVEVLSAVALLGAAGLALLRLPPRARTGEPLSVLGDIAAGLRHLATHRPLAVSTLSGTVTQLGNGAFPVAAVALATERAGSPEAAGWIVTAFSIGGLLGAILLAWRPTRRWGPHRVMLVSFLGTGVGTLSAAVLPGYAAALVAVTVAGLFVAPGVAAMLGIRQEESPPEVRSQVFTVGAGLRASAGAIGAAAAGALGGIGGSALTALVALSWVASAALLLLHRPARPHSPPAGVTA